MVMVNLFGLVIGIIIIHKTQKKRLKIVMIILLLTAIIIGTVIFILAIMFAFSHWQF